MARGRSSVIIPIILLNFIHKHVEREGGRGDRRVHVRSYQEETHPCQTPLTSLTGEVEFVGQTLLFVCMCITELLSPHQVCFRRETVSHLYFPFKTGKSLNKDL